MRHLLFGGVTGMALLFASTVLCFGSTPEADNGAENMMIDAGSKGTVSFPHGRHQNNESISCEACHGLFPKESGIIKNLIGEGVLRSRQVMNSQCISCHRKTTTAGRPSGPRSCSVCH